MLASSREAALVVLLVSGGLCLPASCQTAELAAPTLRQLSRPAGFIFVGRVLSVESIAPSDPNEISTIRVAFRVEQAIRGVRPRQVLTIHQWAGSWNAGTKYLPGERLLLYLYPPSRLGLTSAVAGRFGRFIIDRQGQVVAEEARVAALTSQTSQIGRSRLLHEHHRLSSRDLVRAVRRAAEE